MPEPLIRFRDVVKEYGGDAPLRLRNLTIASNDRLVIRGCDRVAAEMFVHLVSGAAVPDEGVVSIGGVDTKTIATDREWLQSLDRFGVVTDRAVLLTHLSVAANAALPISLAIDPMDAALRLQVNALAEAVDLPSALLDTPASAADALARARLHLARALAGAPELILVERVSDMLPTADDRTAFGRSLGRACASRGVGFVAIDDDAGLARASGGTVMSLDERQGWWARWRSR